jgi:methionyl-tRNA formyltransferase
MRVVVHGQQAFGKAVLDALLKRKAEVVGVYCAPEKEGQKTDPLKEAAVAAGLPVHQPKSWRKPGEVWDQFKSLKPDICLMAYVTLFVPDEVLAIPTHGTIQYHPSLLPKHRGPSSINWPIVWGAKETGLTIFWPDNGLDTGPVLLQKTVPIGDNDTLGSLYFDKLFPMGVDAMLEGMDLVFAGKAAKVKQEETQATYEGWCKAEHAEVQWGRPVQDVWNLIRGTTPQPGAWCRIGGKTVQLSECAKLTTTSTHAPGQITAIGDKTFTVAALGGQIEVLRVRPEGGGKISAAEFANTTGLKVGTALGQ